MAAGKAEIVPGIALESCTGNPVTNNQDAEFGDGEFQKFLQQFRRKWEPAGCVIKQPALLRYNCHGLTFASRRTWIDDAALIPRILAEDGFGEIDPREAGPGDIVVYYTEGGLADHSGIVIEGAKKDGNIVPMPRILSKWAKAYEVVHWANQCPYEVRFIKYYRLKTNTVCLKERPVELLL